MDGKCKVSNEDSKDEDEKRKSQLLNSQIPSPQWAVYWIKYGDQKRF